MGKIGKAVITVAGSGSRLLPFSRGAPKEMLPYCAKAKDGRLILKPVIEGVYESLYEHGCRKFCFITGRGKRSIEDYFLADDSARHARGDLQEFYKKIRSSHIEYVQQPQPRGFGDAVLRAEIFAGSDSFLLNAGDDMVLSPGNSHLQRLESAFFSSGADLAFLVDKVKDPRQYGVVEGESIGAGTFRVRRLEEKPERPRSNLAVVATYIFKPSIFSELEGARPDRNGEIQLESAIESAVARGRCVAVELEARERRLDVGTPESYAACIRDSLEVSKSTGGI